MKLFEQLMSAYRKYKRHVYYDSYSAIQRIALARFEEDLTENLHALERDLSSKSSRKALLRSLTERIGILSFPKSLKTQKSSTGFATALTNRPSECYEVEKVHFFVSLPVEAHILGVLWIGKCGCFLDQMLPEHCYGNRLGSSIVSMFSSDEQDASGPFLFQPYFEKYETWRDEAIASVHHLLDDQKDAILVTLDLMNYYYSASISFENMRADIRSQRESELDELSEWLTDFVEAVFKAYHSKFVFDGASRNPDMPMIPIGFLPSLIIANWNLLSLDEVLTSSLLPVYYGRYVDDIMIVLPILNDKRQNKKNTVFDMSPKEIVEYHFKKKSDDSAIPIFEFVPVLEKDSKTGEPTLVRYDILLRPECFPDADYSYLKVQSTKVKVFTFIHSHSRAILDNFRKEVIRNSSEFRLMHEKKALYDSLSSKLYHLDYSDTINKIRSVEDISVDKFELSKALSWLISAAISDSEHESSNNYTKIVEIFNGSGCIEFMFLWEKLLIFLFAEKKLKDLEEVIAKIRDAIKKVSVHSSLQFQPKGMNVSNSIRDTLSDFFKAVLLRVLALRRGVDSEFYEKIGVDPLDIDMLSLTSSLMLPHHIMKWPLKWPTRKCSTYDLVDPKQTYKYIELGEIDRPFPRYVHYHELALDKLTNLPRDGSLTYLDEARVDYERINGICIDKDFFRKDACPAGCPHLANAACDMNFSCPVEALEGQPRLHNVLAVGNENAHSVKIGLVNTKLRFDDFLSNLKGAPNRSSDRHDHLANVLNEAARKKVNMLVMPEVYVPYEWLPRVAEFSRRHQIAMVFGVEHLVYNSTGLGRNEKQAANIIATFLPTKSENGYYNCVPVLRVKNHYAPDELRRIRQYKLAPFMNRNPYYILFIWNDIYFVPYYCFEIADINDRAIFKGCADIIVASEYNRDANYFANITESLSRDLYCYCIQVNTSEYGLNSIIAPAKTEQKYQVQLKGGEDDYVVTQTLDIDALRNAQIVEYTTDTKDIRNKSGLEFKPQPPGFNNHIVRSKMKLPDYTNDR